MTIEGIRLRINRYRRKLGVKRRRNRLRTTDFTIISNNCWGGMIYESYGLPKGSPTVGAFFMADDYIRFVSDLRGYLSEELVFIDPKESKWADQLKSDARFGSYPIARLNDIEILFLHGHTAQEAGEKWRRRCERIRWDRLIIKFNDQNGCTEEHVKAFAALPYERKLFFTVKDWNVKSWEGYCRIRQWPKGESVTASHEPFGRNRYIDLEAFINRTAD